MLVPTSGSMLSSRSSETVMAAAAAKELSRLWAEEEPPMESPIADLTKKRISLFANFGYFMGDVSPILVFN